MFLYERDQYAESEDLRGDHLTDSPMMAHLLSALEAGTDIGDYGRLAFVMIARYFMNETEIVSLIGSQPNMDEETARAILNHIRSEDYIPPTRDQILEWQAIQDFAICPDPENPESCNIYEQLRFPAQVYAAPG